MTFDYKKFVSENKLTLTSKLKDRFLKEEDFDKLKNKRSDLLAKYKSGEISLDQYKTKMGDTPQKIKSVKADADPIQNKEEEAEGVPDSDQTQEENL